MDFALESRTADARRSFSITRFRGEMPEDGDSVLSGILVVLVRGSLEAPRVYRTSLRALVDGDGRDVELAPGDIVFVTRTRLANIRDVLTALGPLLFGAQNVGLAVGLSRAN